jgi:hypothetical protein
LPIRKPAEHVLSQVRTAQQILDIDAELTDLDAMTEMTFGQYQLAGVITSMPGLGSLLGAELSLANMAGHI